MTKTIRVGLVIVLAIAALSGLFILDQHVRADEYERFLTLTEKAEGLMEMHIDRGQTLFKPNMDSAPYMRAWQDYGEDARDTSTKLAVVKERMSDSSFLPWHSEIQEANDDFLQHIGAWMARYEDEYEFSQYLSPESTIDPPKVSTDISITFELAKESSREAIPPLFKRDFVERHAQEFEG